MYVYSQIGMFIHVAVEGNNCLSEVVRCGYVAWFTEKECSPNEALFKTESTACCCLAFDVHRT